MRAANLVVVCILIVAGLVLAYRQQGVGGLGSPTTPPAPSAPSSTSTSGSTTPPKSESVAKPASGVAASDRPSTPRPAASASAAPTELRIGAFNIEWLGKPEDRSGRGTNVAQEPSDLADYIIFSKVDVLGVCEIVTRVAGRPLRSRELEATIAEINKRTGDRWEYALNPGRSDGDQLTGVLWNTRTVTAINPDDSVWRQGADEPWPLPIPRGRSSQGSSLWNRPPHAMKFRAGAVDSGKSDFVLIVVHMKADYQGDFAAHRKEEADALVRVLPQVRKQFGEQDVIVAGDSNCVAVDEPAIKAFVAAGLVDLNASGKTTHWRGGSMDRVLVPADQPEFKSRFFEVESDPYLKARGMRPEDFKRRFSDHYLVETMLKVASDDD